MDTSEFKNENVSVTIAKNPGCSVTLDIRVSSPAAKAAYTKAIKVVNKEASLPGFRKGKAPEALVIQNFGKYIDQEWHEILTKTAFQEALDLTKVYPFSEESIKRPELKSASRDDGAHLVIEFEARPEVPSVDPKDLQLKTIEKKSISEAKVNQAIEEICWHHAQWEDVADREVQEGDYVDLDIEAVATNPPKNLCTDTRFEAVKGKMGDWMLKLIMGLKVGDSAEGLSEKEPENCEEEGCTHEHHKHKSEFEPTQCKITIKAIKKATLPEVDDELAKKVGCQNVAEMREKVAKDLELRAEEQVRSGLREQLENLLAEKYRFDLPASLIDHEKYYRVQQKMREIQESGAELNEEKVKEIEGIVSNEVDKSFRLFFLSRKIAEDAGIVVSQDEIVQELMKQIYMRSSLIDESMEPNEVRSRLYVSILARKTTDYLVDLAAKI